MTSKLPTRMILALPLAAVLAMPAFADGNLRHSLKPVTEPEIAEVRGRTVRVRVPDGMKSITLQRKTGRRATPWVTLSQATVDDSKNVVTFTLRSRMPRHMLRVFGQQKGKLPSAFYTGTTNFLGEKVVSVPRKVALKVMLDPMSSVRHRSFLAMSPLTASQTTAYMGPPSTLGRKLSKGPDA